MSSGTNNIGVCNVNPSFYSLSFGYLPQLTHIKLMWQVVKPIQRKCWMKWLKPSCIIINILNNVNMLRIQRTTSVLRIILCHFIKCFVANRFLQVKSSLLQSVKEAKIMLFYSVFSAWFDPLKMLNFALGISYSCGSFFHLTAFILTCL